MRHVGDGPRKSWLQPPAHISADAFIRGAGLNILLVVASGVLASFMFPPREVWWFSWLDLVPLLIALRRTGTIRAAGWLTLLFGIVFLTCTLTWLDAIFSFSVIGIYVLASLPWVFFGLGYRMAVGRTARWRTPWLAGLAVVMLAPVLWVAVEWIRCEGWYFQFSWAQFGFCMASCRRGGVLYPYIGVYGVSFLIMFVNALIVELLMVWQRLVKRLAWLAVCVVPVIALSLYLNVPVGIPNAPGEHTRAFRVEVVQNESGDLEALKTQTLQLASLHPNLIVWPEYAIMDYPLSYPKVLDELQQVARQMRSTLVLGCKEHVPAHAHVDWLRRRAMMSMEGALFGNAALVIAPDGRVLGSYLKTHPIQFFSDGVPGGKYPTFATPVGRIGIAICYDFDFASCPLKLVKHGAELLVAPTFDSGDWSDVQHTQHARMAQARAAEMNRWVVRATSSGVSQIINPSGFVTSVIWSGEPATAIGVAVSQHPQSWYVRIGYLLPQACLLFACCWFVTYIVGGFALRRKTAR